MIRQKPYTSCPYFPRENIDSVNKLSTSMLSRKDGNSSMFGILAEADQHNLSDVELPPDLFPHTACLTLVAAFVNECGRDVPKAALVLSHEAVCGKETGQCGETGDCTADRVISETCVRAMKKDLKAPPVSCLRFPFSSFSDLYVPWKYMDESKEEHVRK